MSNQLHELLAVEGDRRNKAQLLMQEAGKTFSARQDHFDGLKKIYTPDDEDGEKIPPETKLVATTVAQKLHYVQENIADALDAQLSKEETNASGQAAATLTVDGVELGNFSATSLLGMEAFFTKYRDMLRSIPTLDPTRTWSRDKQKSEDTYFSDPEVTYRTVKELDRFIKAEATDKHPAQVEIVNLNKQVGHYDTTYESGRLTVTEKADMLNRVDRLLIAIKEARAVANQAEVKNVKAAKKVFDFLNKGIV